MFDTKRHGLLPALLKGDSSMTANFIPEGYHTVTPYLFVPNAAEMIEFLKQAFDATELERFTQPDGSVGHGEVRIGDSVVMVSQAHGEWKAMPASLYLYVRDAEARYKRAIELGATSLMEPGMRMNTWASSQVPVKALSFQSLFRPGTVLTWRGLTS
jgi:uncharacterized glyoxalase superfamily protein PhnB